MKPRLFILLVSLIVFSFTSKAQNLTLEQTVDYINGVLESGQIEYFPGNNINNQTNRVKIDKSGRITFLMYKEADKTTTPWGSFNVFDLESTEWQEYNSTNLGVTGLLKFYTKDKSFPAMFRGFSKANADRFYKAILHLKDVCTKSLDPFGN